MATQPKLTKRDGRWTFAEGGRTKMFGSGDRTVTAKQDAAGPQRPAVTGHAVTGDASGQRVAKGGPKVSRSPSLAMPAAPAKTAPPRKGR
jgi:hypothetical protein